MLNSPIARATPTGNIPETHLSITGKTLVPLVFVIEGFHCTSSGRLLRINTNSKNNNFADLLTECSSRHLVTMSSVPNLSMLLTVGGMVP